MGQKADWLRLAMQVFAGVVVSIGTVAVIAGTLLEPPTGGVAVKVECPYAVSP